MKFKPGWACALSTFIFAGTVHAQSAPPVLYPPQYLAHVSIQAASFTELEVVPSGGTGLPPVARCTAYCDFWAPPGKYTLFAHDRSTGERKNLSLRIKRSSRFEFEAGDDGARSTGLALGIAGSVSLLVGLVLILPAMMSSSSDSERDGATVGLGLLLAGAVATPIGWAMYSQNRTRLTRIDEGSYRPTETKVRVAVIGLGQGGLGLGGMVTF